MIDIYALAKNPLVFQKQRTITSAYIDVSGKMGLAQTVLMVQDNITENFGSIKKWAAFGWCPGRSLSS